MADTFARTFMRIYDRKINSGEISFSRSGIDKNDFTRLCVDGTYVIPREKMENVFVKMNMSEEEIESLLKYYQDME